MAVLDPNEIFFTAFEPKQQNRFIMYIDGIPSYTVKGMGAVTLTQGTVPLNHINVQRFVKGKSTWGEIQFTLFDPITPSYPSWPTYPGVTWGPPTSICENPLKTAIPSRDIKFVETAEGVKVPSEGIKVG